MRLFELCSHEDKLQLFQLLIGKTREVLGLNQADVASMARQDSSTSAKPKTHGIVRAKGLISAKKKSTQKGLEEEPATGLSHPSSDSRPSSTFTAPRSTCAYHVESARTGGI